MEPKKEAAKLNRAFEALNIIAHAVNEVYIKNTQEKHSKFLDTLPKGGKSFKNLLKE
jgi:hypothetical protein